MQSSSNSRPWVGPTNEEETEYNKKPTLLAPGSGSASQRDPERDPASAAERDPRSAADHVPKSDSNKRMYMSLAFRSNLYLIAKHQSLVLVGGSGLSG